MTVNIDGRECVFEQGEYLLEIAARNGIFIPRFCHHPGLSGQACCRVCVVETELNGRGAVVTACVYPAQDGMTVKTNSERIKKLRAGVLGLLAARAPASDRVNMTLSYVGGTLPERYIKEEDEKCILCGLCVRACESIGTGAISAVGRGTGKKISTPYDEPSEDCVGCLSCASVCPTSAISYTQTDEERQIWGRCFELVKCESCGAVIGTREEIEHSLNRAEKTGGIPDKQEKLLCESCRKKAAADVFAKAYGFGG